MTLPSKTSWFLAVAWVIAGIVVFYAMVVLSLSWNLFSWNFSFEMTEFIIIAVAVLAVLSIFFLAKKSRHGFEIWVSFIVALVLFGYAIAIFIEHHSETLGTAIFSRSTYSPHWFHLLVLAFFTAPAVIWLLLPFKYWKDRNRVE